MKARTLGGVTLALLASIGAALWFLPGYVERDQGGVTSHSPYPISARAAAMHKQLFIADLHADALLWQRSLLERANRGQVDVPRLLAGGVRLQVFSAVTRSPHNLNYVRNDPGSDDLVSLAMVQLQPPRTWFSPFERARYQAAKLASVDAASTALTIIRNRADLERVLAHQAAGQQEVAALLALEGLHALEGSLSNLATLWADGYRMAGLQHFFDNDLGGSLHGVDKHGLTAFGRRTVDAMRKRGMIIDLAHSSEAVVRDTLALTAQARPQDWPAVALLVSHSGFKGACNTPRNISDALMQSIAARGGLIGVGFWQEAICDPTPAGIARSIRYGIALVGEDHVALGSDFDGTVITTFDASEYVALTQALLTAGLRDAQIVKVMGGNVRRFMTEHLPPR